jgi:hypothetical protein
MIDGIPDGSAQEQKIAQQTRTAQKQSEHDGKVQTCEEKGEQPDEYVQHECTDCCETQLMMQSIQPIRPPSSRIFHRVSGNTAEKSILFLRHFLYYIIFSMDMQGIFEIFNALY